jgi:hypothetical protein
MAGDLIVDKVRSGVMRKWRERYQLALEDLAAAGLTLVRDDEVEGRQQPAAAGMPPTPQGPEQSPEEESPFTMDLDASLSLDDEEEPELPTLDDLALGAVEPQPATAAADTGTPPATEAEADAAAGRPQPAAPQETSAPPTSIEEDVPPVEPLGEQAETTGPRETDPQVARMLDAVCESLSRLEGAAEENRQATCAEIGEALAFLEGRAEEMERATAVNACRTMSEMCQAIAQGTVAANDRFIELAYAFCGMYAEADEEATGGWAAECRALLAAPSAEEPPTTESQAVPTEEAGQQKDNSPQHLLDTARLAVSDGKVADAKLLALQAAVRIASVQADEAEARLKDTEARLKEGTKAIDAGRQAVKQAEQEVSATEERVSECKQRLDARSTRTAEVAKEVEGLQEQITQLDDKLREIQAQRDLAEQQRLEAETNLEKARANESAVKAELERQTESEREARVALEDARQNVKALQRKRAEIESAMEKARELLVRRKASVTDIQETIDAIRSAEDGDSADPDELLF